MKFNRNLIVNNSAVSSVIGTVLMVAIVVSIASILYISLSSDATENSASFTPSALTIVNSDNGFMVANCDVDTLWDQFSIKTDHANTTISINGGPLYRVGMNWTNINTTNFEVSDYVIAGDNFTIHGVEDVEYIIIYIKNDPANKLQGRWIINI
jgi:flagellin-like protein